MKTIDTLVEDIYKLFDSDEHHEPSEENLEALAEGIKNVVRQQLAERDLERSPLRFSNLGKPDRRLWYEVNMPDKAEKMLPKTYFKFLYGHVIEQLLLFLAKEAGHKVEDEQREVEVDGVKGHIDARIDGVVTDAKSASPYSFTKFIDGGLYDNDPFGYIGQLSGYAETVEPGEGGAFLVADKVHGDIGLMKVDGDTTRQFEPEKRIKHLKEVITDPELPTRCYAPEPEGKSGNMKLGTNCSYCPFKFECWKDSNDGRGLRVFKYYKGPMFLTHINREPITEEVTDEYE